MTHLTKRGQTYHFDQVVGGRRLRCSLGTHDPRSASRLANRISFAIADGPRSPVWSDLKYSLPASSYDVLTTSAGVALQPNLVEFEKLYLQHLNSRVKIGNLSERSRTLYETAARRFFTEMHEMSVHKMDSITPGIVDDYCVGRKEEMQAKGGSGRGMIFEMSVLSSIFSFAVQEGLLQTSPLKRRPRPEAEPEGAEPFTPEELKVLDFAYRTPRENLIYLLFRRTGLRCSDVADLRWDAINWRDKTLTWRTKKRGKSVTIPLMDDLMKNLKGAWIDGTEKVLNGMGTKQIYRTIKDYGERNSIKDVYPHRFRDTMAVTMLEKGASIYDVAKILGDTVATIEKHYAPFTKQLQERVRGIMENVA